MPTRPIPSPSPLTVRVLLPLVALLPALGAAADPSAASPDTGLFPRLLPGFFDDDGYLDMSEVLDKPSGFFPLVSPITEPAVGYGAAFVPIFIDAPEDGGRPDIWAAGAMATDNGSRAYFGTYSKYLDEDRWRIFLTGIDASVNLDFHGLGRLTPDGGTPLRYNLDSTRGLVGAERRIGDTPWRAGLRFAYGEIRPSLLLPSGAARVNRPDFVGRFGPFDFSSTVSSLQATLTYDTRDNIFTPTRGLFSEFGLSANLTALGASDDYQVLSWTGIWYRPLVDDCLYLGWRGDAEQSFGDVPFYSRPSINLRGAPAQRYQGAGLVSTEAELRWQLHPRWSVLTFAGAGLTWPGESRIGKVDSTFTGGVGFRYLVARKQGIHFGVDLAYGEEGSAFYIQFGSGWFRP